MTKKLGVMILNWNGRSLLERFLPGVVADCPDADTEVVVVDNGSTDDSVAWVREHCPTVRLMAFDENLGFAAGYNRAIAAVDYPFVVLLNSDVRTTPGWTRPLLAFMESHPQAGACQPKIRSEARHEYFEYAGAAGGLIDCNGYPYCLGRVLSRVEKDTGQYDSAGPHRVAWASGAALMVRAEVYKTLGGLDEAFFAHMEEIDLCVRMQSAGYGVYALTDTVVYHVGGASLAQGNPKKTYLNFRNNLLMLYKNMPQGGGKRWFLFRRRLLDTLAWAMYCVRLDGRNAAAVVKAHRDFRRMRRNYNSFPDRNVIKTLPGARRSIFFIH